MSPLIPKRLRRELADLNRAGRAMDRPIVVSVGGVPYEALLVAGSMRFKSNWAVLRAAGAAPDMTALRMAFLTEKLSLREYAEFHMLLGYSLDGFCDLDPFSDLEVKTPNWTREGRTPWK